MLAAWSTSASGDADAACDHMLSTLPWHDFMRNSILQLGRFPVRMALGSEQQTFEGELVRAVRCMVQGSAQWAGWLDPKSI